VYLSPSIHCVFKPPLYYIVYLIPSFFTIMCVYPHLLSYNVYLNPLSLFYNVYSNPLSLYLNVYLNPISLYYNVYLNPLSLYMPRSICTLLQTLYRIIPSVHGYKCFVEVREVDTRQVRSCICSCSCSRSRI
jgi:hypothetical protein